MRVFAVAWRSLVSFYNELFLFLGVSVLWWVTGGVFVAAVLIFGYPMLEIGGPFWLAPLLAIPAGPASAALANVARRAARDLHVDRSFYWEGFRAYWRQALAIQAVSMGVLALLLLNLLFYLGRPGIVQALALLWAYLIVFWGSVQLYLFPVLIALKEPTVWGTLRTAVILAFGNPLFSILLVVIALALTALSIFIPILVLLAWPAVMGLLGEHSLMVFVERAGVAGKGSDEEKPH